MTSGSPPVTSIPRSDSSAAGLPSSRARTSAQETPSCRAMFFSKRPFSARRSSSRSRAFMLAGGDLALVDVEIHPEGRPLHQRAPVADDPWIPEVGEDAVHVDLPRRVGHHDLRELLVELGALGRVGHRARLLVY